MELIEVIKEPYFNKKSASPSTNKFVLTFLVDKNANKVMIKKAFHSFFGVRALAVNTLIKHPKRARVTQKSRKNFTKAKKIAYVSLLREDFLALKRALEGDSELIEKELEAMKAEETKVVEPAEPLALEVKEAEAEEIKVEEQPKKKPKSKAQKDSETIKADTIEELSEEKVKEDSEGSKE